MDARHAVLDRFTEEIPEIKIERQRPSGRTDGQRNPPSSSTLPLHSGRNE